MTSNKHSRPTNATKSPGARGRNSAITEKLPNNKLNQLEQHNKAARTRCAVRREPTPQQHTDNRRAGEMRDKSPKRSNGPRFRRNSGEKKKTQRAIARRQSSCHSPTVTNKDGCVEQRLRAAQHLRNPRPGDQTPPTTS